MIKVELPGFGDQSRWLPLAADDSRSAFFIGYNRGKRSVTIDLRRDAGRQVFLRLCATVDVVVTNFKPGTMESWGVGYEDLAAANPRLVYATGRPSANWVPTPTARAPTSAPKPPAD